MNKTKPFIISKDLVMQAFKSVKENNGAAGVDQQSIVEFEENLKDRYRMQKFKYSPTF